MKLSFLVCLFAFSPYAKAATPPCVSPTTALASAEWGTIRPVPAGTVALFSTSFGWQGLNQIYPSSVVPEHRWRAILPWGVPTIVERFNGRLPLNAIMNTKPVFYLKASDLDSRLPVFTEGAVRLFKLKQIKSGRTLTLTRGTTSFTQKWLYTSRQNLPVVLRRLSESTLEVWPQEPLKDGEYLMSLGLDGSTKYEFSIRCSAG